VVAGSRGGAGSVQSPNRPPDRAFRGHPGDSTSAQDSTGFVEPLVKRRGDLADDTRRDGV